MDTTFYIYAGSFELAARELASKPWTMNDPSQQAQICAKYGIFFDNITDDEISMLGRMVEEYSNEF